MKTILDITNTDFLYHEHDDYASQLTKEFSDRFFHILIVMLALVVLGMAIHIIANKIADHKRKKADHLKGVEFKYNNNTKTWTAVDKKLNIVVNGADLWKVTAQIKEIKQKYEG